MMMSSLKMLERVSVRTREKIDLNSRIISKIAVVHDHTTPTQTHEMKKMC